MTEQGPEIKHVAINARFLLPNGLEGIGRFTDEIVKRWVAAEPNTHFSLFFDRPFDPKFIYGPNVKGYVLRPPARHPILFWIWFEIQVTRMLNRLQPDVFFSPDGFLSLRSSIPQVPVFHDLAYLRFPEDIKKSENWYYRRYFPLYAKKATRIVTVSAFSKLDIMRNFGLEDQFIDVAGNGCSATFFSISEEKQKETRARFTESCPYFLAVGAIQPRKNLVGLIAAFELFKKNNPSFKLVIVGRKAWNFDKIINSYQNSVYKNDIIFTGILNDEDLNLITASAEAMCYVSLFEGFGIPILEAMRAGTAVICSDVSSMPEVAGGATLLVDPKNPHAIASAMEKIVLNPELKSALIHKGTVRSMYYSWEQSAKNAWNSLKKAKFSAQ